MLDENDIAFNTEMEQQVSRENMRGLKQDLRSHGKICRMLLRNKFYFRGSVDHFQIIGNGNKVTIKVPQSLLSITNPDLKVTIKAQGIHIPNELGHEYRDNV